MLQYNVESDVFEVVVSDFRFPRVSPSRSKFHDIRGLDQSRDDVLLRLDPAARHRPLVRTSGDGQILMRSCNHEQCIQKGTQTNPFKLKILNTNNNNNKCSLFTINLIFLRVGV